MHMDCSLNRKEEGKRGRGNFWLKSMANVNKHHAVLVNVALTLVLFDKKIEKKHIKLILQLILIFFFLFYKVGPKI